MTSTCPSTSELKNWLAAASEDGLAGHIAACSGCQRALDALSDDIELRQWAARLADTEPLALDKTIAIPAAPQALPEKVGPYRVQRELGRGGMGVVVLATDDVLQRDVALKLMAVGALRTEARERFLREARAAAKIQHEYVVGIYGAGTADDGSPWLAMEYVNGLTLAEVIHQSPRPPWKTLVDFFIQIADGLSAVHAAGLVHRDVKPSNILIAECAKLADFGMVREGASDLTSTGVIAGTLAYLSPEQARQLAADEWSDVYSLGVTLYEALTGDVPFRGSPLAVLKQIQDDEPRPPRKLDESIPADLETICLKALAKEPERRYAYAKAFGDDLRRWQAGEPILARRAGAVEKTWRWARRNPRVAALAGSVAGLLLALAVGGTVAAVLINRTAKQAERDKQAAEAAQKQSEADLEVALQSFTALIVTVQSEMGNQPGLLPVKRGILETAAEKLRSVVQTGARGEKIDRIRLNARERLGAVYLELGRTADARSEFEAGLRDSERFLLEHPGDLEVGRRAAAAADQLGSLAYYAADYPGALARFRSAQAIRTELAAKHPTLLQLDRDRSVSLGKIGDVQRMTGDTAGAKASYEEALRIGETIPADFPTRGQKLFDMAFIHGRLFDANVLLKDDAAAEKNVKDALVFAEERLRIEPTPGRADVAFNVARLAQLAIRRGDAAAAVPYRRRSVELRRESVREEPTSALGRRALFVDYGLLADALAMAGTMPEAKTQAKASRSGLEQELTADPTSSQKVIDLIVAAERVMGLEALTGDYAAAAEWAGQCASLAGAHEKTPGLAQVKPAELRARYERLKGVYEHAGGDGPVALANSLDILRAANLAREGNFSEALALAEGVTLDGEDSRLRFELANVCCRCAKDEALRMHAIERALAVLEHLVKTDPGAGAVAAPWSEFAVLKTEPRFRKLAGLP